MYLGLLLALVQAPAAVADSATITRVEIVPAAAEIPVGGVVQLRARAVDASGAMVPNTEIHWFSVGGGASVDSTGLVRGGYTGTARITALASVNGVGRPTLGEAAVKVLPRPAALVEIRPAVRKLAVGTRLTLNAWVFSAEGDRRYDPVDFRSSNRGVATVSPDGRLVAARPGTATISATAGGTTSTLGVQVVSSRVARLTVDSAPRTVLTGDVVRFVARPRDARGRPIADVAVEWGLSAMSAKAVAQIDAQGKFVGETPGKYTVTASVGGLTADAVVHVELRRVGRGLEVVGRLPLAVRGAEVWVHPGGKCAYLTTIADRVYAVDITTPSMPRIVDSMLTDARIINDVMTTEDGRYGVFSREAASTRQNGIVIFDAADPCHPKPIAEYTATVSGGVHSTYVHQGRVYLTDDATGSLRVIDIRDPLQPVEVGRWQTEQTAEGRYLHDVSVQDGLAYLSYWNDGLVILDVGNGLKGGSPERPQFVSRYKYPLDEIYARVDQLYGLGARGTHTAWRKGKYVFVGDEVYAARPAAGLQDGNNLTFGRLNVIDVSNIENPNGVAWYEPTDGGVHNFWIEGDTLYMGAYQGGARALDISGELKGDLLRQGREISWLATADSAGTRPRATFAWGAVVKDGLIYVPDMNSGLWVLRLEERREVAVP